MKKLTIEQRKALTEYIGECWHKNDPVLLRCKCGAKGESANRTFTTDDDMLAIFRKLEEKGDWQPFENSAYVKYEQSEGIRFKDMTHNPANFTCWLFIDPARFCDLFGEWMEKERRMNDGWNQR